MIRKTSEISCDQCGAGKPVHGNICNKKCVELYNAKETIRRWILEINPDSFGIYKTARKEMEDEEQ